MKRVLTALVGAAVLLSLAACADTAGNVISKTGEVVSDVGSGAGDLMSRAGEGVSQGASKAESFLEGRSSPSPRPSASPMPGSSGSPLMDDSDGEVRDENGTIGDEDYEEAHDGVESFVEEHQTQDVEDLAQ